MSGADDVLKALNESGPLTANEVQTATGMNLKSVNARLYELRKQELVVRSGDGHFTATALERPPSNGHEPSSPLPDEGPDVPRDVPGPQAQRKREPLTGDAGRFRDLLQDCDIRKGLDTITEGVFSGDPEDLDFVMSVLEDARAFIPPMNRRMIIRTWARYIERVIPFKLEERLSKPPDGSQPATSESLVEDIGWKVEKDRDGDFVPKPGGELTYTLALRHAATMNATRPPPDDDEEDEGDMVIETPGRRGKKGTNQTLMSLMIQKLLGGNGNDEVKELRAEMAKLKDDQMQTMLAGMQAQMAELANRDPLQELAKAKALLQAIEGTPAPPMVTDASPTVQLIKDQSDKMDKNMNRIVGFAERLMLREAANYVPEDAGDEDQEARAANIAARMDQTGRSRELRTDLFRK